MSKETIVLTTPEIEAALVVAIGTRPSHRGKFCGAIEFLVDAANPDETLRIRANMTLFDTQKSAMEYHAALVAPKAEAGT